MEKHKQFFAAKVKQSQGIFFFINQSETKFKIVAVKTRHFQKLVPKFLRNHQILFR